ncbi:MAG: tRNA (N(6)-L-threonylcarbamoyladenosine(37)-C(2))-methylthiotransferase MtaB [candidate division Zixibacteria bacterium 4484_95]|nr:MAG: tRNA (N(6)-L-threonylcarbamoyladenosine(37)-C(2))-methylthiotransferase MtaB [candidate division Zixibacteria bacterium 4484_95]
MLKVAFSAVGCKINQYEVQCMAEALEPYCFQVVPFDERADIYVINTCTVTAKADYTSRQMIRRALRKSGKVIVTGCYAELEPSTIKSLGNITFVTGNKQKRDLPQIILNLCKIKNDKASGYSITRMDGHSRAFIKIQEGCTERCSYCIIWKARGKPSSRDPGEIIKEINDLYQNGYNEVVLTGVHIGKFKNGFNLTGLLKTILKETEIPRVRLSSLKPDEFKNELIELLATERRICPHVHLPVQSGDDTILQRMGRRYSAKSVYQLVNRLVEARQGITIGADFIVGFPGETKDDFENTIAMVKDIPIVHLHIFPYSDRPGTPASLFSDKISPQEKSERSKRLKRIGDKKKRAHMKSFIGKKLDVIVENRQSSGRLNGISGNYLRVGFTGDDTLMKKYVEIKVNEFSNDALQGDPNSIKLINDKK